MAFAGFITTDDQTMKYGPYRVELTAESPTFVGLYPFDHFTIQVIGPPERPLQKPKPKKPRQTLLTPWWKKFDKR